MSDRYHGKTVRMKNFGHRVAWGFDKNVSIDRFSTDNDTNMLHKFCGQNVTDRVVDEKHIPFTEIDRKYDLYDRVISKSDIQFNKKNEYKKFLQDLKTSNVKHEKFFNSFKNTTVHSYNIPVTHIISIKNGKETITESNKDDNEFITFAINVVNVDCIQDGTYRAISPDWFYSKDTHPRSSGKRVMTRNAKMDLKEYDDGFDLDEMEKN